AHGEPTRPGRPHEHALPCDDEALVRRRSGPQPGDPEGGGHGGLPCPAAGGLRRARPDFLSALLEMGRGLLPDSASRSSARRRRHLLRASRMLGAWRRTELRAQFRFHARRRRGLPRRLPKDRSGPAQHAVQRGRRAPAARIPRPLRRVQSALRPRHALRSQDGRKHRRHPYEPAASGRLEMSYDDVRNGDLAAVVTFLEMREKPQQTTIPPSPLSLRRMENPQTDAYRGLFRQVGSPWLWFSRLVMDDAKLAE